MTPHFRELRERVYLLDYPKTRIFSLSGPDHVRYLHNRLTQEIKALTPGQGTEALVLTPNGRIQGQFLVLKREKDILLLTDELTDESLVEEVKRAILQFKVADQVELKDLSNELAHLALVGDPVHTQGEKLGLAPTTTEQFGHETREIAGVQSIVVRSESPITKRYDLLVPTFSVLPLKMAATVGGIASAEPAFREAFRILSGRGKLAVDLPFEKILAPEYAIESSVSFRKGCYPGQEVVEMATARGRPNRKFVQVLLEGERTAPEDLFEGEKSVGTTTSALFLPELGKSIALGFVKSDTGELLRDGALTSPGELRKLLFG